jgi:hypothetical protein
VVYRLSAGELRHLELHEPALAPQRHRLIARVLAGRVIHLTDAIDALQRRRHHCDLGRVVLTCGLTAGRCRTRVDGPGDRFVDAGCRISAVGLGDAQP